MKLTTNVVLMLAVTVSVASGQIVKPGKCPKFTPKPDFDIKSYVGTWFEIERFPTLYAEGQRCVYTEYTDIGNGKIGVHDASFDKNDNYLELFGYAETSDVPGKLLFHLDGVPEVGNYNVLDTDYTTFASVYSCQNMVGFYVQEAWLLGRPRSFTEEQRELAIEPFTRFGISPKDFEPTPQENCSIP
ncbi:apolipoprotein D-like [Oratosquilla oratoria]|uniref:apolipoprotein D-like n=1 Tax=Oratosquilla oratoria TaxID=337810 RepID=UPI003F7616F4